MTIIYIPEYISDVGGIYRNIPISLMGDNSYEEFWQKVPISLRFDLVFDEDRSNQDIRYCIVPGLSYRIMSLTFSDSTQSSFNFPSPFNQVDFLDLSLNPDIRNVIFKGETYSNFRMIKVLENGR